MNNSIPYLGHGISNLINSFLFIDLFNDDLSINLSKYYVICHFIYLGREDFSNSRIFDRFKCIFSWYKWYDRNPNLKHIHPNNLNTFYPLPKRIIKKLNNDIKLANLINNIYNNWPNDKQKAHNAFLQIEYITTPKLNKKYYVHTLPKYKQYFNNWLK